MNVQTPRALLIKELLMEILSYSLDNASAYYVCTGWFETIDELLCRKKMEALGVFDPPFAYARQTAAALRLGFKLRDWQGYRFLMRKKGRRLIQKSSHGGYISFGWGRPDAIVVEDLIGDVGGVNGLFAASELPINNELYKFHNFMLAGAVLAKKVVVTAVSLDLTEEVSFTFAIEDLRDFDALSAEAVSAACGRSAQEVADLLPEILTGGVPFEVTHSGPRAPLIETKADSVSLELALELAEGHGRGGDTTWGSLIGESSWDKEKTEGGDDDDEEAMQAPAPGVAPGTLGVLFNGTFVDVLADVLVDAGRGDPPETFRDGMFEEMMSLGWSEGEEEQLPEDARTLAAEWLEARERVALMRRAHFPATVAIDVDSEAIGDLKGMLVYMLAAGFFDDESPVPDLMLLAAHRKGETGQNK